MVCLGLEPGAAGWKVQMNPLSYGGTPKIGTFTSIERWVVYWSLFSLKLLNLGRFYTNEKLFFILQPSFLISVLFGKAENK